MPQPPWPEQERLKKLTVRFETPPGKQAQADWAYCGRFPDVTGRIVPVYAFVMVLSFSRMLYVEVHFFDASAGADPLPYQRLRAFRRMAA
jgi:transposase